MIYVIIIPKNFQYKMYLTQSINFARKMSDERLVTGELPLFTQ